MNFRLLFSLPPKPPKHGVEERNEIARRVVMRLTGCSMLFQKSQSNIDAQKKQHTLLKGIIERLRF